MLHVDLLQNRESFLLVLYSTHERGIIKDIILAQFVIITKGDSASRTESQKLNNSSNLSLQ